MSENGQRYFQVLAALIYICPPPSKIIGKLPALINLCPPPPPAPPPPNPPPTPKIIRKASALSNLFP